MTGPERLIELGRISAAQGLQGWVKVQPHSGEATVLLRARQWWLRPLAGGAAPSACLRSVTVQTARLQGRAVVAQLQEVTERNQAEALRGHTVLVPRSAFPVPEPGEYYWVDLIGCDVFGEADGESVRLGRVEALTDNGAHGVLRVTRLAPDDTALLDARGRTQEVLIPFVAAHIGAVDMGARRIKTNWPLDF